MVNYKGNFGLIDIQGNFIPPDSFPSFNAALTAAYKLTRRCGDKNKQFIVINDKYETLALARMEVFRNGNTACLYDKFDGEKAILRYIKTAIEKNPRITKRIPVDILTQLR